MGLELAMEAAYQAYKSKEAEEIGGKGRDRLQREMSSITRRKKQPRRKARNW